MSGGFKNFLMGTPESFSQQSRLGSPQQPIFQNLTNAAQQSGAGGAFGDTADYYRSLLAGGNEQVNQMAAPEQRRFQQETIPGLANQFAGLGAGGLSSSGFRNAAVGAGTDLNERIAAMRANLRMQGAQGLQGIGKESLGDYFQNNFRPRSPGFLEQIAPGIGTAIGAGLTGGLSGLAKGGLSSLLPWLKTLFESGGNSAGTLGSASDSASGVNPDYYNQWKGTLA